MKKFLTFILCILYTVTSLGGTVFVHNCENNSLLSIYEEFSHDDCPFCVSLHKEVGKCEDGDCSDIEIQIDALEDTFFSHSKVEKTLFTPLVFQRLWVEVNSIPILNFQIDLFKSFRSYKLYASPPLYLLNCIIRG